MTSVILARRNAANDTVGGGSWQAFSPGQAAVTGSPGDTISLTAGAWSFSFTGRRYDFIDSVYVPAEGGPYYLDDLTPPSKVPPVGSPTGSANPLAGVFPARGALVGINVQTISGSGLTYDQTIAEHEVMVGRKADVIHNYHWLVTAFPNAQESARTKAGQIILTSVQSRNNSGVIPWADVAAGNYDAAIDAYAAGVKSLAPSPVWVNWINEPDLQTTTSGNVAVGAQNTDGFTALGTPAEFRASYRRFVDRFRQLGVTIDIGQPLPIALFRCSTSGLGDHALRGLSFMGDQKDASAP